MKKSLNIGLKIQIAIGAILIFSSIIAVVWLKDKFQTQMHETAKQNATEIAVMSLNTLNMFMLTGLIGDENNRKMFYEKTKASEEIVDFRVFRSPLITSQYGAGIEIEAPKDDLDKKVLQTGEISIVNEMVGDKNTLRIVYPYKASTNFRGTDCTTCHSAKAGEVLGAASITIDISEATEKINSTVNFLWLMAFALLATVLIFINIASTKLVSIPLKEFQESLMAFFAYLNKEKSHIELIPINSSDEIAQMAKFVNENVKKIEKTIIEDNELIEDAKIVVHRVNNGWYSQLISKHTSNPSLEEFKINVNTMITNTKKRFEHINQILDTYSKNDYTATLKMEVNDEKGGVFEKLVFGLNTLQQTITKMLVENKITGVTLQHSASALLENVNQLNQSSNEAAARLEETAAALEEITSNVTSTSYKVAEMSNLANLVTKSANDGQELARRTTEAMDDINTKVSTINEAISVIDQIAFQTNILSLNAAVEAATAGEAGKGFAVVAQEVRNLANRSSDAAKEIKMIVENAKNKATEGKLIADDMIVGYETLNSNISKTMQLISDVNIASREQQQGIVQINSAVSALDHQTQQNANVASQTQDVALDTSKLANELVRSADQKKFNGQ